jgi:hypothetical protein
VPLDRDLVKLLKECQWNVKLAAKIFH